jgi:glycosyltransferase involved in cell wall biosynthesis
LPAWRRLKVAAVQFVERRLLAGATIVAVSRDLERYLRGRYPGANVVFVPNGVRAPREACDRAQARARWNIPGDAFWVGAVARLEPVKNLPCLVRAAALLRESVPGLRVSIFGEGAERPALERCVAAEKLEDIVTLHGFTDDAAETVGGFDCFVLSSFHEGLPMSLLEAMARGVPPVCSRVGGMAELITHGRSGLLFESNDHVGLADCLRQVHDSKDAALRMGQAARALVAGSYSIEVTNTALLKVYQSVISGGGLAGPRSKAEARS